MKLFLAFICSLSCAVLSLQQVLASHSVLNAEQANSHEVLYLPSTQALQFAGFGYKVLLSDLLWFKTISYFGKHYAGDRNYHWLSHMCELVTTLDPRKDFTYDFCSALLSWEANAPGESLRILTRAIETFPDNWRYYYLRGFTSMFFLKDEQAARNDFLKASKLPDAHPIVARLLAKKMALSGDLNEALVFLREMRQSARNPYQQQALDERYREVRYELDLQNLEKALAIFRAKTGGFPLKLEELVEHGIVSSLPQDPFNGVYYLDSTSGQIRSTSNRKRLEKQEFRKTGQ